MRTVLTYTTLGELQSSPIYAAIRECPHIAMSKRSSKFLIDEDVFPNSISFQGILKEIAPKWKSDDTQMSDMAEISKLIRVMRSNSPKEDQLWYDGCLKQTYQMWSAIMMLEEANVRPAELEPRDRNQRLMKDVWTSLENTSQGIKVIRSVKNDSLTAEKLKAILDKPNVCNEHRVLVHGFYYITPIQERILRIIEGMGYNLTFVFQYDDRYPLANEVWDLLYNGRYGFPDKSRWVQVGASIKNDFGEMLEGNETTGDRFQLKKYRSVAEFANDPSVLDDNIKLFSPDNKSANEILREFHPELYGRRPLITYPIGGFIDALHHLWDQEQDHIVLDVETLAECFAYGWMTYKNKRSSEYLLDLQKISVFFKGCSTFDQWRERLGMLKEIQDDVQSVFKVGRNDRWEKFMGDPLSNFSQFSVDDGGVAVISLINNLIDTAEKLFGNGLGSSVSDHISRLLSLLKEEAVDSDEMRNELTHAEDTLSRISSPYNHTRFLPSDLSNAITAYLRNEFSIQEDDVDSHGSVVSPMHGLDVTFDSNVHVVLSDMPNLPGKKKDYTWPLNQACLDRLEAHQKIMDNNPLIGFAKFITETNIEANRHLMYSASWNHKVIISWIRMIDGKLHSPSPYVELILGLKGIKRDNIPTPAYVNATKTRIDLIRPGCSDDVFRLGERDIPEDATIDLSLCPLRFVYGYVIGKHPVFMSEFQQGFAASGLISALDSLRSEAGLDKESIRRCVTDLFPNLTEVEKRSIVDSVPSTEYPGMTRYKDRLYTRHRFDVRYPSPIRSKIKARKQNFERDGEFHIWDSSDDSGICMYCPDSYHCRMAKFKVDDKHV